MIYSHALKGRVSQNRKVYEGVIPYNTTMETREIKGKEGKSFRVVLLKNTFSNGDSNYSVVTFLKKSGMELSRDVFDTLRKAENKFKKEVNKMGYVTEEQFELPDHRDIDYSMTEYDLYARLRMSIRKNLKTGQFEIFRLDENRTVVFTGNLHEVVQEANRLEGAENTFIKVEAKN